MREEKQGSITVEATLVLPIFLAAIYVFLFFFQILMLQETLHKEGTKIVKDISSYGAIANVLLKEQEEEINNIQKEQDDEKESTIWQAMGQFDSNIIKGNLIDSIYFLERMRSILKEHPLIHECIEGGYGGILFYGSSIFDEEECVTLTMAYKIKFPVFESIIPKFTTIQTIRMRSFNGFAVASRLPPKEPDSAEGEETQEETMVYITEHGKVYHTHPNCTYLRPSVTSCPIEAIQNMRNSNKGKYYPCERCFKKGSTIPDTVYITRTGNRYHKNAQCTAICHKIIKIPISQVGNRRLCKRCQKYE